MYYGVWYRVPVTDREQLQGFLEPLVGPTFEDRGVARTVTAIGDDFSWDLVETDEYLEDEELHLDEYPLAVEIRPRGRHGDSPAALAEARRIFEASRPSGHDAMLVWDVQTVIDRTGGGG